MDGFHSENRKCIESDQRQTTYRCTSNSADVFASAQGLLNTMLGFGSSLSALLALPPPPRPCWVLLSDANINSWIVQCFMLLQFGRLHPSWDVIIQLDPRARSVTVHAHTAFTECYISRKNTWWKCLY